MSEEWKDIYGYEGFYQVSNHGRIRSLDRVIIDIIGRRHPIKGQFITPHHNEKGYLTVRLRDGKNNRKNYRVNRIVALHFCSGYKENLIVNHINEKRDDNRAENLEWCTYKQNANHGTFREKLHGRTSRKGLIKGVLQFKNDILIGSYKTVLEASNKTGIKKNLIYSACSGHSKSAAGYKWKYLE